jgi:hypothetical protein
MKFHLALLVCLVVLCWSRTSAAQSGGGFDLSWSTIDGGGMMFSVGSGFELGGTIGQPDASAASAMTGTGFALTGGFWAVTLPACTSFAPADFNQDCSVDNQDLATFEACVTGPDVPYNPASLPPGCTLPPDGNGHVAADFNGDSDVDLRDFGIFQRCYSGPGKPANPNCAN